ncbi:urease accessory protein UreF [Halorarius halobius]|uniref:urease accessory protein UreF n=1 Tax=Halorarius halobius TaxID=2962671 RepID=UPI0020CC37ED|nr:urease accessory UreF family protein [Halorarius halobius]
MSDDTALEAFRLGDSFLPVGSYTVSSGLEQFVQNDRIENATDLEALLRTYLRQQVGRADLVALRAAHTGARADDLDAVSAADDRLAAVTLSAELRETAQRLGARLLSLERDLHDGGHVEAYAERVDAGATPGTYAVVLGLTTGSAGIEERRACLLYCHGFTTGLVGSAQRLLSFGHTEAQRLIDGLTPAMIAAVDTSEGRSLDSMDPFCPLVDILSAEHERADRRLFVS